MSAAASGPSRTPALDDWYAEHPNASSSDRPTVNCWMPQAAPFARLQTIGSGCNEPDRLPDSPPIAYLTIGGVTIGGYLEDLELLVAASAEWLAEVRKQAEAMAGPDGLKPMWKPSANARSQADPR